jgi:hypothetical protein
MLWMERLPSEPCGAGACAWAHRFWLAPGKVTSPFVSVINSAPVLLDPFIGKVFSVALRVRVRPVVEPVLKKLLHLILPT